MPWFRSYDDTQLAYEEYGAGAPILFAGSVMLSADMWEYQIPRFVEQGYRCVIIEWRGHGRSDRPSAGYDFDAIAADLAALIEHLDLRDLTVIGQSMGAAGAAELIARQGTTRIRRVAFTRR